MSTVAQVFSSKRLWAWFDDTVTQSFDGNVEKGQDYSTTFGTPVGVPVGGRVVRIVGHTNSIGDIVELQDSTGGVWLYQHITARVRLGDVLQCGSVVGTENGLPVDQYSTGPHIEVRYCPPGQWSPGIDSWYEPWIGPKTIFGSIGGQQAGVIAPSLFSFFTGGGKPLPENPGRGLPYVSGVLKPNDDVNMVLATTDYWLILSNPFDVDVPKFTIAGAEISDPIGYAHNVLDALVADLSALIIRIVIGGLGVFLLYKVTSTWVDWGAVASTATGLVRTAGMAA